MSQETAYEITDYDSLCEEDKGVRSETASKSGGLAGFGSARHPPQRATVVGVAPEEMVFEGAPPETLRLMPAPKGSSQPDQSHHELPTPR
ncbi:hypothetical protein SRHO_G00300990 [Serrasalmus rhombeus]